MKYSQTPRSQRGVTHALPAALITVIAMVAGIATTQLALVSNAKTTLDYAALMGARAGSVGHGDPDSILEGVLEGVAPLYGSRSAPHGEPAAGTTGVDWVLPNPSSVDLFGQSMMGPESGFSSEFEDAMERTKRADASPEAAVEAARDDLLRGAGESFSVSDARRWVCEMVSSCTPDEWGVDSDTSMLAVAITNPVREAFDDFGNDTVEGVRELPNKGIWRRTGNPEGASTQNILVCEDVVEPNYQDPTLPPAFDEPSVSMVEDMVGAFTWDRERLKQEQNTDCEELGLMGCGGWSGDSPLEVYIDQVSGPYGEQFGADVDAVVQDYYDANIDAPEMWRRIRDEAVEFRARFDSAGVESVRRCRTRGPAGTCWRYETYTPDEKDWGPMSRIDELIDLTYMMENGTGRVPEGGTLLPGTFEAAIGDWRERTLNNGVSSAQWDSFAANELEPLWEQWIEEPQAPMYERFLDNAAAAAGNYDGMSGFTDSQQAYLTYLQAVSNGRNQDNRDYIKSQDCTIKQVEGYVPPTVGTDSDLNIQDANILRVVVLYGHEPYFDLPRSFYRAMGWANRAVVLEPFAVPSSLRPVYFSIIASGRIPILSTAMVRMQSELRESDLMLSRDDVFFARFNEAGL